MKEEEQTERKQTMTQRQMEDARRMQREWRNMMIGRLMSRTARFEVRRQVEPVGAMKMTDVTTRQIRRQ